MPVPSPKQWKAIVLFNTVCGMVTYIWASPFKIRDYYLVGATPPFATFNEAEKALFEVVRAGLIGEKHGDVEVHPTHLKPLLRMYLEQNQDETGYALPPDLMLNVSDVEAVFLNRKRGAVRRGRPRKLNLPAADYADVQRMARMISSGEAKTKHAAAQKLALSLPEHLRNAKVKFLLRAFDTVWHT